MVPTVRRWWPAAAALVVLAALALLLRSSPDNAAAVGDSLQEQWDHTVETYHSVRELPQRLLTDQPVCEPVAPAAGYPLPVAAFEEGTRRNWFNVQLQHASCAWIDFNVAHSPDTHFIWEIPAVLVPEQHWRSEHIWATNTMTVPFTLTAVGPGGVTVLEGEHTFRRGD